MRRSKRLARRSTQLLIGLLLYGIGSAFLVRATLGPAPWDVLNLGLTNHLPLSFGTTNVVVSVAVLLLWIPLRERPGIGTVANALLVGPAADLGLAVIPARGEPWLLVCYFAAGLLLVGVATGLYIGARFGPGPRDGLMTGLNRVTGLPIWVVRTALEIAVVLVGWVLGGVVGVGTLVFALAIGPLCQLFLRVFTVRLDEE